MSEAEDTAVSPRKTAYGTLIRRPLNGRADAWSFVPNERVGALLGRHPSVLPTMIADPGLECVVGQWVYRWLPGELPVLATVH